MDAITTLGRQNGELEPHSNCGMLRIAKVALVP